MGVFCMHVQFDSKTIFGKEMKLWTALAEVFLSGLSLSLQETHRTQSEVFVWISLRNSPGGKAAGTVVQRKPNRELRLFPLVLFEHFNTHQFIFLQRGSGGTRMKQHGARQ